MVKQMRFLWVSVLLLILAGCGNRVERVARYQTVQTDTVCGADGEAVLQFPGRVKAAQDISLAFKVSGTISRFAVKEGATVRQGQLLAELDAADYQVQLDATEAEYKQIKADAQRVMSLYRQEVTTASANDKAVYGLRQIEAKLQHHKDQLAYTRLYAPFSGTVQMHLFEAHETVAAGMPVIAMVGVGDPEIEINLPAAEYIRREQFIRYTCTISLYPGREFPLSLISIAPKANANQLYTMRLRIHADGVIQPAPGMNAMVTIIGAAASDDLLSVPTGALLRKDGKTYVFTYREAERQVKSVEVEVKQLLSNGRAVICSSALKRGEVIVASGVHHIQDGERVEPLPAVSKTNVGGLL